MALKRFISIGLTVVLALALAISVAEAQDIPPPVYAVEITDYDGVIYQSPGTVKTYKVEVTNSGVMGLDLIRLGSDRLEKDWFSTTGSLMLEFEEKGELEYSIALPSGAEGQHVFFIVAYGSVAENQVSDKRIVVLNVGDEEDFVGNDITATQEIETTDDIGPAGSGTGTTSVHTDDTQEEDPEPVGIFEGVRSRFESIRTALGQWFGDDLLMLELLTTVLIILLVIVLIRKLIL